MCQHLYPLHKLLSAKIFSGWHYAFRKISFDQTSYLGKTRHIKLKSNKKNLAVVHFQGIASLITLSCPMFDHYIWKEVLMVDILQVIRVFLLCNLSQCQKFNNRPIFKFLFIIFAYFHQFFNFCCFSNVNKKKIPGTIQIFKFCENNIYK